MAKLQANKEFAESILKGIEYEGKTIFEWVKLISKKDFVEVVRCSECQHWGGVTFGFICRKFSGVNTKICMHADDYCSYGERRLKE